MPVHFNFPAPVSLRNRTVLKEYILSIFKKEKRKAGTINFIFCSDDFILDINRTFLQHDYYTDIITFDLSEPGSKIIDAELYISIDTVRTNSILFNTSLIQELHRVIFHGVLHLCGYKDKTKTDIKIMRSKEEYYLKAYKK